jgi:hypothetical protein
VKPRIIPSSVRRKQLAEVLNIFRGGEDQACTSRIRDAVMHRVHYGTLDLLVLHADEGLTTVSQRRVAPLQTSSRRIHPLRVHLQRSDLKENSPDIMAIVIVSQSCPWCVCVVGTGTSAWPVRGESADHGKEGGFSGEPRESHKLLVRRCRCVRFGVPSEPYLVATRSDRRGALP